MLRSRTIVVGLLQLPHCAGLIAGKRLTCAIRDVDRYGRLVGQCFLPDGRDIAAEVIRSGAALEYCRYSRGYYGTC